jgi:nucleoside-diphosphate-sugar epimerase
VVNLLVTGSAGHLGEALMRTLPREGYRPIGLDLKTSPFTQLVGSVVDRSFVRSCMRGVDAVVHTATLHKAVDGRHAPGYEDVYAVRGWAMFPRIDRVYVNARARTELGWEPRYSFAYVLDRVANGGDFRSALAHTIGSKGYHDVVFEDGPYPT